MIFRKKITLFIALISLGFTKIQAQDLKAGEINVKYLSGYTYEATVILYQNISTFLSRPYLLIDWGDGAWDTIRAAPTGCGDANTTTFKYDTAHTYSGPGTYLISCADSFRIAGIVNISNSINEKLVLRYNLVISSIWGPNSSPTSLNCAVSDWWCCNWTYNPGCFDSNGDSLSYSLVSPITSNYTLPPSTCNALTGDITLSPTVIGQHSLCQRIDEWRKWGSIYYLIGTTYRDMLVDVSSLSGIDDKLKDHNKFFVYPNPAAGKLTIELNDVIYNKEFSLAIYDALGRQWISLEFEGRKQEVDISFLPNGIYQLQILSGNLVATKKFVRH